MIKRLSLKHLLRLARQYPVVMVIGPRQSGKTTLCRYAFPDKPYCLLEDPDRREHATSDPRGFLSQYPSGAILDEIQKAPELVSYLQGIVDDQKKNGLFILTGSQNLLLSSKISQSLAGRTAILKLLPLSFGEVAANLRSMSADEILCKGFYPRIYDQKLTPFEAMNFYFQTYIERDVREIVNVNNLLRFQKFVKLCAGRAGQLLNLSSLGNDAGVSHQTASDWISLLEASFIVYRLPPYHNNFNKRVIKSPKLYFYDVGLASYLLGVETASQMSRDPLKGHLFENLIVSEFMKLRFNAAKESNLAFFRDSNGNEVDVVFEGSRGVTAVEIKSGETAVEDFFKGLEHFTKLSGRKSVKQYLVYGGNRDGLRNQAALVPFKKCGSIVL